MEAQITGAPMQASPGNPVQLHIEYPPRLSRGILILKTLFAWLYVGIPHLILLGLYGIGVWIVTIIAWFAILFTGRYPKGMFDFVVGYMRWQQRVSAYLFLLTDAYPPFRGSP